MGPSWLSDSLGAPTAQGSLGEAKKNVGRFAIMTGLKHAQTAVATSRRVALDVAVVGCTLRDE